MLVVWLIANLIDVRVVNIREEISVICMTLPNVRISSLMRDRIFPFSG